jgi:hypothetical protein
MNGSKLSATASGNGTETPPAQNAKPKTQNPKPETQNLNPLRLNLEDLHCHSLRDLINYPRRIPIRQADTTVAP